MCEKFIFITGGVLSSLGKGITSASIAFLLEEQGLKVAILKLDPYLNVDPGTMNPYQHGEVYVTEDGAETDLDLGHYHRFSKSPLSRLSNATSGQIYDAILKKERKGEFLGKTVQVIPHITDEIQARILGCARQQPDIQVLIVEIGGTVGDIESQPFLEAMRQFRYDHGDNCLNLHLTFVPYISHTNEIKTKPTQHSVQLLQRSGVFPDMILCRGQAPLDEDNKHKISLFCNVQHHDVIDILDAPHTVYEVPLQLHKESLDQIITQKIGLPYRSVDLSAWQAMIQKFITLEKSLKVGIAGKYLENQDSYISIFEALKHAGIQNGVKIEIVPIDAEALPTSEKTQKALSQCDGIIVPGGFGQRGWEGKIWAANYCRTNDIPYFGICLGMQILVVEFAQNALQWKDANSTEIDTSTDHKVISLLEEQEDVQNLGGTMRLGAYECKLTKDSLTHKAYKEDRITERHRHRYEFNNAYKEDFEAKGLRITGINPKTHLCEIVENQNHQWMVGVQFHPEYQSTPLQPHPLFVDFVKACKKHNMNTLKTPHQDVKPVSL